MEEFRASAAFRVKVAKGTIASYHVDFKECRERMKELYPKVDTSCLVAELSKSENGEDEENGADTPKIEVLKEPSHLLDGVAAIEATIMSVVSDIATNYAYRKEAQSGATPSNISASAVTDVGAPPDGSQVHLSDDFKIDSSEDWPIPKVGA